MILTRRDYRKYLEADLKATGIYGCRWIDRIRDRRYKFYRSLRICEYYYNIRDKKGGVERCNQVYIEAIINKA